MNFTPDFDTEPLLKYYDLWAFFMFPEENLYYDSRMWPKEYIL